MASYASRQSDEGAVADFVPGRDPVSDIDIEAAHWDRDAGPTDAVGDDTPGGAYGDSVSDVKAAHLDCDVRPVDATEDDASSVDPVDTL
jgi:hypothetical protein